VERETQRSSDLGRSETPRDRVGPDAPLTRAEEHALRRSAPLTPTQFKTLRRMAEQGISPLRHI
jgi:predicted nuclease with RNAse H fold